MILIALRQLELNRTHPAHALCICITRVYFRILLKRGHTHSGRFQEGANPNPIGTTPYKIIGKANFRRGGGANQSQGGKSIRLHAREKGSSQKDRACISQRNATTMCIRFPDKLTALQRAILNSFESFCQFMYLVYILGTNRRHTMLQIQTRKRTA